MSILSPHYRRHRFPAEIISHCVLLYFRFPLSYRDVEEMMRRRGVSVTYETVQYWCRKFGQTYADGLRRKRSRRGDRRHLDEVFITINGRTHYLRRAVDQDGDVPDILVQSRRDKKAAKKVFRKLLKGLQYEPRVIITDELKSYSAAKVEIMPSIEHHQDKGLNNRAENSHQPTRLREKVMRRFKSAGHARAVSLRLRDHLVSFPAGKALVLCRRLPGSNEVKIRRMGRGEMCSGSSLMEALG